MSFDCQTGYTGSPVNSNTISTETQLTSPANNRIVSFAYIAPPNTLLYSTVSTISPVINNLNTRVAVVSPLISNTVFSPIVINPPVIDTTCNIYSLASTPMKRSVIHSSMEEGSEGKESKLNKSSSSQKSNGTLDDSYSIVGYQTSPTTIACGRGNKAGWYEMHDRHKEMAARINATVVLCGDSIIAGLTRYTGVWNKYFKPWNALNCGIGGDQTQHVLWRMENMELPLTVKYIVIHCGTNNIDRDSSQEIANGVISCGLVLQDNNPELKIIVTGLLPRDREKSNRRHKIAQTNKFLKRYCRQFSNFIYMRQDDDWVLDSGLLNEKLYYTDHLHLIESGNHKLAKSITNILTKLSENEEIVYSDEEFECATNECKFERKRGETRLETPKQDNTVYKSQYKLVRSVPTLKRKRTLSPVRSIELTNSSLKHRKTDDSALDLKLKERERQDLKLKERDRLDLKLKEREHLKSNSYTPIGNSRKRAIIPDREKTEKKVDKNEYHGQFLLTKELKHDRLHSEINDTPLAGTAKSIDISLADKERLAARKAKFGVTSTVVSTPDSSLRRLSDISKASIRLFKGSIKKL